MYSDSHRSNNPFRGPDRAGDDNDSTYFSVNSLMSLFVNTDDPSRKLLVSCRKEETIQNVCKSIANIYYETFLRPAEKPEKPLNNDFYYEKYENKIVKVEHLAFNGFILPALHKIGELLENKAVVTAKIIFCKSPPQDIWTSDKKLKNFQKPAPVFRGKLTKDDSVEDERPIRAMKVLSDSSDEEIIPQKKLKVEGSQTGILKDPKEKQDLQFAQPKKKRGRPPKNDLSKNNSLKPSPYDKGAKTSQQKASQWKKEESSDESSEEVIKPRSYKQKEASKTSLFGSQNGGMSRFPMKKKVESSDDSSDSALMTPSKRLPKNKNMFKPAPKLATKKKIIGDDSDSSSS